MLSYISRFEKSYTFQRWYCCSLTYFIWQILCYCLLYNPSMSWYIAKHLEAWFWICFSLSMWKIIVQYYLRIYDILLFRCDSANKKIPNRMLEKQDWKFYVKSTVQSILLWAAFFQCLQLRRNSCPELTDCLKIFFLWCKLISKEFCKGESYFWVFLEVML